MKEIDRRGKEVAKVRNDEVKEKLSINNIAKSRRKMHQTKQSPMPMEAVATNGMNIQYIGTNNAQQTQKAPSDKKTCIDQ